MEVPLLIVKILGPCFILVAVSMVLNRGFFKKAMEDYCKNAALMLFSAMATLTFGIAVVILHNIWAPNWRVIITIIGWIGIVKGLWLILLPNTVCKVMRAYVKNDALLALHSTLAFFLGVVLTVLGYFS